MGRPRSVRPRAGGNPQIPKGDGPEPVAAYIAAMPGWMRAVGEDLDRLIVAAVPDVVKAVRWNMPFYGMPGRGYFLSWHCMPRYVKVSFFQGAALKPMPPGASKQPPLRYLDIFQNTVLDEAQFAKWALQAAALPGWQP